MLIMKKSNSLLKRKYGKDGHVIASLNGPKRNKILEFVNIHGKVDIRSLRIFISNLNESKHNSSASTSMWMKRNEKYFIRESKNGGIYYKLSPLGKRLLKSVNEGKENRADNKLVEEILSNASTYKREIEKANESIKQDPTSVKSLRKKELIEELIKLNEEEDTKKMLLDDTDDDAADDFSDEDLSSDADDTDVDDTDVDDTDVEKVEITEFILTVDDVDAAIEELEAKDIIASKVPDHESDEEDTYKTDEISVSIEDWEKLKEWLEEKGIDVEDMFGGEIEVEDIEDIDDDIEEEGSDLEDFDLEEEVSEGDNEDDDLEDDEATDDDFDFDDEDDEGDDEDDDEATDDDFDFDDEEDDNEFDVSDEDNDDFGDEGEDETDLGLQLIDIGKKLIQNDKE
jgi:hypothetical protein